MPNDTNIDHADMLEAAGAFDDGFDDAEYQHFLDSLVDREAEERYWETRYKELQVNPAEEF